MAATPEPTIEPTTVTEQPRYDGPDSRLGQVAAWVVIVAGVVFVVAVVFFSGLLLGWSSGRHHDWERGYGGGRGASCPMVGPGGVTWPGGMMGPGGMIVPRQTPTTTAPPAPRP